jgi:hypothetical protein
MPRVGFEPTIPVFERTKIVHALDGAATEIDIILLYSSKIVDKKEILRTVSNSGIYCSSDKVGTVDLV